MKLPFAPTFFLLSFLILPSCSIICPPGTSTGTCVARSIGAAATGAGLVLLVGEVVDDDGDEDGERVDVPRPDAVGTLPSGFLVVASSKREAFYSLHTFSGPTRRSGFVRCTFAGKEYRGVVSVVAEDLALVTFEEDLEIEPIPLAESYQEGNRVFIFTRDNGTISSSIDSLNDGRIRTEYIATTGDSGSVVLRQNADEPSGYELVTVIQQFFGIGPDLREVFPPE